MFATFIDAVTTTDLLIFAIWVGASFVQGLCGMGSAMIAIPLMTLFISPHEAILISCLASPFYTTYMCSVHGRHANKKALLTLMISAVPGALLGIFILEILSGKMLQIMLGVTLIVFLIWQLMMNRSKGQESTPLAVLSGLMAGFFGSSISIDGPPIAAYGLYAQWAPKVFLGTLSFCFFIRGGITAVLQAIDGLYSATICHEAILVVLGALLGLAIATPFVRYIKPEMFKHLVRLIILVCAVTSLSQAF